MQKVTSLIDVAAPCHEVFKIIVNLERRMQLSPLWGVSRLLEAAPDLPQPGSTYRVRVLTGTPFGVARGTLNASESALAGFTQFLTLKMKQAGTNPVKRKELDLTESGAAAVHEVSETHPVEQEYMVSEYQPPHKFSYVLDTDCKTIVTWRCREIPYGTRINYEEIFCDENVMDEDFLPTVRHVIQEWLTNIKRYSELREGRGRVFVKWFLDRFYLKQRPDQRRVLLMILAMQMIGLATFVFAVIGWGVAFLLFGFSF